VFHRVSAPQSQWLLHNALRVDEACAANVADLGADTGHRILRVTRKGARKANVPLTPATAAALDTYLTDRGAPGRTGPAQLAGPLLGTTTGGRLRQAPVGAGPPPGPHRGHRAWQELSPHWLRHSAITLALDAGATLRDVQDYVGHKDPAPSAATATPATAWTATPPTRSRPTSRSQLLGSIEPRPGWTATAAGSLLTLTSAE
jgi:integrase/recombinase XerD